MGDQFLGRAHKQAVGNDVRIVASLAQQDRNAFQPMPGQLPAGGGDAVDGQFHPCCILKGGGDGRCIQPGADGDIRQGFAIEEVAAFDEAGVLERCQQVEAAARRQDIGQSHD